MSRFAALLVAAALAVLAPARAFALYHLAHISEIMAGITGNPSVQYVEIRMDVGFQNIVGNTRLTVFDCTGTTATVLLTIPDPGTAAGQVPNQGGGRHWIMGTSTLAGATTPSVTPDFVMAQGIPTSCGMVCWGAPADPMTFTAEPPNTWNQSDPNNYIDCVAYGPYTGPQRTACTGFPLVSDNPGDGTFSLTRNTNTCYDFSLACPTPTNNGPPSGAEVTGTFGPCTAPTTTTTVATTTTTTVTTLAFGGDDPGCPPDSSDHLKCGDAIVKALSKMIGTVIKCHAKQADAAYKVSIGKTASFDEEACETLDPVSHKSAKEKYDTAVSKVASICSTTQLSGANAARDTILTALDGSLNAAVYCEGTSDIDSGGDDSGKVPTSAASSKCEDAIGKNVAKLAAGVLRCHFKLADAAFKNKPFDEETCEATDPVSHKGALDKYNQARDKLVGGGLCAAGCQNGSAQDTLAASMTGTLETLNDKPYPCP